MECQKMPYPICVDPGHKYILTGGHGLTFIKRTNGELINEGTTNEELLNILIHRTKYLNDMFLPCNENLAAIAHMEQALRAFEARTAKRIAQGVETKDVPHVS